MDNLQGLTAATSDVKKQFGPATKVQFVFRAGSPCSRTREKERGAAKGRAEERRYEDRAGAFKLSLNLVA